MAAATKTPAKYTPKVIETANNLMAWMKDNGNTKWRPKLKATEGGAPAIAVVDEALAELGRTDAVVFLAYGTGALKAAFGADAYSQEAIVALKETGRLLQFGRGRGYCLILLDDTAIAGPGVKIKETPTPDVAQVAQPANGRKRRATAANTPEQLLEEMTAAITSLRAEYEARIAELEAQKQEMAEQIQTHQTATWA